MEEQLLRQNRFCGKLGAAAQLRHPNIVTVYEIGRDQDDIFIVSDFVQGMTLADFLKDHVFTADEAVQLCVTLATTLDHAHQAGVVHRDLKPANIMLDHTNRPYIMDFGLAKWDGADITVSLDGKLLGTPAYTSPEQAGGCSHQADRRSDVYSLGVILFQLLTDSLPFEGDTHTVLHRVIHDEAPSLRRLNRNITRDLEAVCLKSLAKRPDDRYQTARDMASDLRRILTGQPVHARTVTTASRVWKWCRRNPVLAGLVTALSLSIVIGIAGMTVMWRSAVAEMDNARTARDMQQRQSFELAFDRALRLCQDGEIGPGLLWMVRSLELAPPASEDIANVVRRNIAYWQSQLVSLERFLDIEANVSCAAFSPDERHVLIGAKNGVASLWEVSTGRLIEELNTASNNVTAVALSDSIAITANDEAGNSVLRFWSLKSGKSIGSPVSDLPRISESELLAINPLGATFVSAHGDEIYLWDLESREVISRMRHDDQVRSVRFSSDGKHILTASVDQTARIWNAKTGVPDGELIDAKNSLFAAAYNQDSSRFVTGGDGDVTIWDSFSRTPLVHLTSHIGRIRTLEFSPSGNEIIANGGGTIWIWDLRSRLISQYLNLDCNTMIVSPDATYLFADATDREPRIWRLPQHAARDWFEHGGPVWGVDMSQDGKTLVTSGGGGLRVWNVASRRLLLQRESDFTGCVAMSPTDPSLAAVTASDNLQLFDMESLDAIGITMSHSNWINQVAFSSDGRQILTACADAKGARIWNTESGQLVHEIPHPDIVLAAAFHPDGKSFVTACEDGFARLWKTSTAKQIGGGMRHSAGLLDVAISADGSLIAAATADGKAFVWDVRTQRPIGRPFHHEARVRSVTFSPDGNYIATGCEDGTVRYWHIATGMPLVLPRRHTQTAYEIKWSPHGAIVTGSRDGTARLWPIPPKPIQGGIERIRLQVELATGLSLDSNSELVVLNKRRWRLLRRKEQGSNREQ